MMPVVIFLFFLRLMTDEAVPKQNL